MLRVFRYSFVLFLTCLSLNACTVLAIADAAVSTTVKVGSAVVGMAIDVKKAGIHAVTTSDNPKEK